MFVFKHIQADKKTGYETMLNQLSGLLEGETDWLANLSNTASHLIHSLPDLNWAGFYLLKDEELVLGPFMGKPACVRIPVSKGVCGTAVKEKRTLLVKDVTTFPGHIACDADSRSEVVIPLYVNRQIIGVLDIDSPKQARFDEEDVANLEKYAGILLKKTDWSPLLSRQS
ncbi:GAF domain-containing protein [Thermoactinomyces mirandus]|uniref:GAF domain-containing protein n=1 Tax=Thermoactinomyces mirandus TaxID=2756294 RepID=A0A7W1XQT1_9BACL|nr:GAF domain-containing protein [Thermoactinomyces mirandus]MBA4601440.1 GAF domain-containing protein [Thermoactinomyces mirandus]